MSAINPGIGACVLAAGGGEKCRSSFNQRLGAGGYKSCNCPPADFDDWRKLVQKFAEHLVSRFAIRTDGSFELAV
jgi:hypothetical protein